MELLFSLLLVGMTGAAIVSFFLYCLICYFVEGRR